MNMANIGLIKNRNEQELSVLLNGQKDLEEKLQQFKKECHAYDKYQRNCNKTRYYQLALMAKVDTNTTGEEIERLLKNNTRTFLIDVVPHKSHEVEHLTKLIRRVVNEQQSEELSLKLVIGLALQITGDACRIGRIRNNSSLLLSSGDCMTLTTNIAYRYSGFKEIVYVINLQHYMPHIKVNDEVSIGNRVRGVVVKKFKASIALHIQNVGVVNSYDLIDLPNQRLLSSSDDIFNRDLETATKLDVDFIVLPYIRCLAFLKLFQHNLRRNYKFKLIGTIDLEYISSKMEDLMSIIKQLDYLWLTNLFGNDPTINKMLLRDVIPLAKRLKKPIIGSVPLQRCNDFRIFENHEFLWNVDCMLIEKSVWCNKYPLIVKKLLPIKNYRLAFVENSAAMHDILSNIQSIVHFIVRTITSIECQGIFLHTKCNVAAKALSRVEIYCPVYVIIPLEEDYNNNVDLTRNLNLRRNLKPLLYTKEMNECKYKPVDFGIAYARKSGCLETGDFIITVEVGKENGGEHVQLGVNDDTVLLRAIYVPPIKMGESFECS